MRIESPRGDGNRERIIQMHVAALVMRIESPRGDGNTKDGHFTASFRTCNEN